MKYFFNNNYFLTWIETFFDDYHFCHELKHFLIIIFIAWHTGKYNSYKKNTPYARYNSYKKIHLQIHTRKISESCWPICCDFRKSVAQPVKNWVAYKQVDVKMDPRILMRKWVKFKGKVDFNPINHGGHMASRWNVILTSQIIFWVYPKPHHLTKFHYNPTIFLAFMPPPPWLIELRFWMIEWSVMVWVSLILKVHRYWSVYFNPIWHRGHMAPQR